MSELFTNKILALDIGDKWTGCAISDASKILAKPLKTISTTDLATGLAEVLKKEPVTIVVIGHPITMQGKASEQTAKIVKTKDNLCNIFKDMKFILWDERLSSQRAKLVGTVKNKEEKIKSHSIAAAFILDSYLQFIRNKI